MEIWNSWFPFSLWQLFLKIHRLRKVVYTNFTYSFLFLSIFQEYFPIQLSITNCLVCGELTHWANFYSGRKTIAPIQLLKGLPELLNTCAFSKTLSWKFGTEQKLKQEHNACLCLNREACGNGQSLANCLQLCSSTSPLYVSKVRHFRILTNSTQCRSLTQICNCLLPITYLKLFLL